jgi:hypothetical protein
MMSVTNSPNGFKHKILQQQFAIGHQVIGRARESRKIAAA